MRGYEKRTSYEARVLTDEEGHKSCYIFHLPNLLQRRLRFQILEQRFDVNSSLRSFGRVQRLCFRETCTRGRSVWTTVVDLTHMPGLSVVSNLD